MPRKTDLFDQTPPEPNSLEELNQLILSSAEPAPGLGRVVLGEGPIGAMLAFVGEQPGDQEDIEGRPFVGPAGALLNQALAHVGVDRKQAYVTNAVKRFRFELRGKRRIHQKPSAGDVAHERWWLTSELSLVHPHLVVALGATAALALTGKPVSITKARGPAEFGKFPGYITVHPSYLLRIPDPAAKHDAYQEFLADIEKIRALAA